LPQKIVSEVNYCELLFLELRKSREKSEILSSQFQKLVRQLVERGNFANEDNAVRAATTSEHRAVEVNEFLFYFVAPDESHIFVVFEGQRRDTVLRDDQSRDPRIILSSDDKLQSRRHLMTGVMTYLLDSPIFKRKSLRIRA
jgi:hypothetical protein